MNPRAVVAGGAGFIGHHLVDLLERQGYDVVIVDNLATGTRRNLEDLVVVDHCEFIRADVCDPVAVPGPVDFVLDLACPASPVDFDHIPIEIMMTCAHGTHNLLELALHKGADFVLASTSEVYGDPEVHPQSEDYTGNVNITGPRSVYDEGKRYAEALAFAYYRKYRVPIHIARIFNTYGPRMRQDDGRVISNFCVQALTGEPLTVYGDGQQTRSFCYVEDLVHGLYRLMHSDQTGPINLGNPAEYTIREIADIVRFAADRQVKIEFRPLLHADDPRRRRPDITKARELLGWEPTVSVEEGLRRTLEWFRSELAAPAEGSHGTCR